MGLAFLITTDNLQLLSERKVLKQHEYAALLDATAVLDAAQYEAHRLLDEAQQAADEQQRAGYAAGWQAAQAEHAARTLSLAWQADAERLAQRERLAGLVAAAVGRFLGDMAPEQLYAAALQRIDALLAEEPVVAITVAPQRRAVAEAALAQALHGRPLAGRYRVAVDPALGADDCRIRTASGHIEIGLQAQIAALQRSVVDAAPGAWAPPGRPEPPCSPIQGQHP